MHGYGECWYELLLLSPLMPTLTVWSWTAFSPAACSETVSCGTAVSWTVSSSVAWSQVPPTLALPSQTVSSWTAFSPATCSETVSCGTAVSWTVSSTAGCSWTKRSSVSACSTEHCAALCSITVSPSSVSVDSVSWLGSGVEHEVGTKSK